MIHSSLIKKIPELELAIGGVITETQAEKIKIIKEHYDALDLCKLNLESVILNLSKPCQKDIELLLSVHSINNIFTAIGILFEIGADMNVFPSAKHLCSWAGLTPTNSESAGKKKSVKISRVGSYLKPLLVQCATAVVASENILKFAIATLISKNVEVIKRQLLLS